LMEALRLDALDGEYWLEWRLYTKFGDMVFEGDSNANRMNCATDALHDLGVVRCLRDEDTAGDRPGTARPLLDVVISSLKHAIETALGAPSKDAHGWKVWELVHYLRKMQPTKRNPNKTKSKARALRWAAQLGNPFALSTPGSSGGNTNATMTPMSSYAPTPPNAALHLTSPLLSSKSPLIGRTSDLKSAVANPLLGTTKKHVTLAPVTIVERSASVEGFHEVDTDNSQQVPVPESHPVQDTQTPNP